MPLNLQAGVPLAGHAGFTPPTGPIATPVIMPPLPSPGPGNTSGTTPANPLVTLPTSATPGTDMDVPGSNAFGAPAASTVPTWAWVLGGVAVIGVLGAILYSVSKNAPAGASEPNPLPRRRRRRRGSRRRRSRL
jgi:hypothetical protein